MRTGWTCKDAAGVLGIAPTRITQSLDPALEKVGKLWRADATRTMVSILDQVARLDSMLGPAASTEELDLLRRFKNGTANRAELSMRC